MRNSPHDRFFHFAFSHRSLYIDFFDQLVPKKFRDLLLIESIEPVEGTFLNKRLQRFFSDKLFSAKLKTGGRVTLACLVEHKSFVPPFIYHQLEQYVVAKREHDRKNKKPLSATIPIVIYHGKEKWKKKPPFAYYGGLPKELRRFVNAPDYILIDVTKFSKKKIMSLRRGYLVNTLLAMKYSHRPSLLDRNYGDIFIFGDFYETTEEGQAFFFGLLKYLFNLTNFDEQKIEKMIDTIPTSQRKRAFNTFDRIRLEGKIEHAQEVATNLLVQFPTWKDDMIANISGLDIKKVKALRKKLADQKKADNNGKADNQK
ncbi:MAG TPA: hypothetical protein ENJ95_04705 [Bacteroidetes bacterium]|nr:hypothetical protein [Bacteroidota bacterium]